MSTSRRHILDLTPDELAAWLDEEGAPAYRLSQIQRWMHVALVETFDEMSNLPAGLRQRLRESFTIDCLEVIRVLTADDGGTRKFLSSLHDGEVVESVAMEDAGRRTLCVSSQAGCGLGCRFCATGSLGLRRDLSTGEILAQVSTMTRLAGAPRNIVFMGMGEPLMNIDAVIAALERLTDPSCFGMSARRIAVSTVGIVPGIRQLIAASVRPSLALSLNSPFEEQRRELMPISRRYPLSEVLPACADYAKVSGRSLMLEYVLLSGVNTSPETARALAKIASTHRGVVNLIAFNPVQGCDFRSPTPQEISGFRRVLESRGIEVSQRYRRGGEIAAGCGQLAGVTPKR